MKSFNKNLQKTFKVRSPNKKYIANEKNSKNETQVSKETLYIPLIFYGLFSFQKKSEIKNFCHSIYKQVNYAINNLVMPDSQLLSARRINIPLTNKKLLLLDLDGTIIHCDESLLDSQIQIYQPDFTLKINFRPYWKKFLINTSKFFDIYIFTSSTRKYANLIVKYLNEDHQFIKGILHRQHCLRTKNGFFIKDLRIIENIDMKKVVIVDNKLYSFSFQLQNGIPIQQFNSDFNDQALQRLQQLLFEVFKAQDVQIFLANKLRIREIINQSEASFTQKVYKMFEQNKNHIG